MEYRYRICAPKAIAALLTCALALLLALAMGLQRTWAGVALFLLIAVMFGSIAVLYGSTLVLDATGIRRCLGPLEWGAARWDQLREVGVVGTKVFNRSDPKRYGTRFIYFSPRELDEAGRFRLALEWPPRRMLYLQYEKARLEAVQMFWSGRIAEYNCGDIFF